MFFYYGKRSCWDLRRLPAILDLPLICLKKSYMKILLPSVLLGPPSVFPKSDQETAAEQHLRRQEKKDEKS